jgi:hypothetical protein
MSDAWDEITPEDWQEIPDSDGKTIAYALLTKCPRCLHDNAIDLNFELDTILDRSATPSVIERSIYAKCECTDDHPGHPAGETGCGQQSSIKFTMPTGRSQ